MFHGASSALASLTYPLPVCTVNDPNYENSLEEGAARLGEASVMNKREMIDLRDLVDRIDRLLKEFLMTSNPDQLAILEAEITGYVEKLKRIAASLISNPN